MKNSLINKKGQVTSSNFQKVWSNRNKNGQVTLFIIVAIVIVTIILGSLFLYGEKEQKKPKEVGPENFIKNCVKATVGDKIQVLLDNGGKLIPTNYINYSDEAFNYLCYQADYYTSCYNLYPDLEETIEKELKDSTKAEIDNCFNMMKTDYEDRGFNVNGIPESYNLDILPGNVKLDIKWKVNISDGETGLEFEDFSTRYPSAIYDLINVAREIINAESQYCYFEYDGYMLLYPQYDIKKTNYIDSKLYWVKDRRSGVEFRFAVRSCAGKNGL